LSELGHLFVVAAASGTGKTSLVRRLVTELDNICISVSHTTRAPRPGDVDGEHYFFTDEEVFERMVHEGVFLEHAGVYGRRYGTSAVWVQQQLQQGIDVILEIDWQGASQVRMLKPESSSIFILPPSLQALRERLYGRGQDEAEVIERRMARAQAEIAHYREFDFLVINDDFEQALADLKHVVLSRRLVRDDQSRRHAALLADLLQKQ
jgi:guanylate kinase